MFRPLLTASRTNPYRNTGLGIGGRSGANFRVTQLTKAVRVTGSSTINKNTRVWR